MPVYLFTYHTYRSWLPDRRRGYTKRDFGYQPPDPTLRDEFDERAKWSPIKLDRRLQDCAIAALQETCRRTSVRLHGVWTDDAHIHVLVSWKHTKPWMTIRASLRTWMTRALRAELDPYEGTVDSKRPVFSRAASRKKVNTFKHFEHLITTYLPTHRGAAWSECVRSD